MKKRNVVARIQPMKRREFLSAAITAPLLATPLANAVGNIPLVAAKTTSAKVSLKMFTNDVDYVIAEDINEARWFVALQYYGEPCVPCGELISYGDWIQLPNRVEDAWGFHKNQIIYFDEVDGFGWEEFPMDKEFRLWEEYPGNNEVVKTVREWIKEHGKGYFACSEY